MKKIFVVALIIIPLFFKAAEARLSPKTKAGLLREAEGAQALTERALENNDKMTGQTTAATKATSDALKAAEETKEDLNKLAENTEKAATDLVQLNIDQEAEREQLAADSAYYLYWQSCKDYWERCCPDCCFMFKCYKMPESVSKIQAEIEANARAAAAAAEKKEMKR